jgi:hypothetical protein
MGDGALVLLPLGGSPYHAAREVRRSRRRRGMGDGALVLLRTA